MMSIELYAEKVQKMIDQIVNSQKENIRKAAAIMADSVKSGGIIFTFGTGHSHMIAEEVMYRAGTLVPIYAILEQGVSGDRDVTKSEFTERLEGYAELILNYHKLTDKDVLIIISNSGRNAVPIEMAMGAKKRGIPVIAVTSLEYSKGQPSRHSSGKRLFELADVTIDNCGVLGDAVIKLDGLEQPVAPTSNLTANFIIHSLTMETVIALLDMGITPPVFFSGNLDGAREKNEEYLAQYWNRIRVW
jgi:uncharacterized phosphosugar-binding protein